MIWSFRPLRVTRRTYAVLAGVHSESNPSLIVLRPYQNDCIQSCLDALASGSTRIGVSLPTGSGKTTVFLSLLSHIPSPKSRPSASRSLVIVNNIELARQSAEQATRLFPQWSVEIEQGARHNASGLADLTVATYQTLLRTERVKKFDPNFLKCIIVDEAHHSAAPSYRKLLSQFDPNILHPDRNVQPPNLPHSIPIIGFSATFSRHDGLMLGSVFERIVYHRDFLDMIKDQWLCDIRFTCVKADLKLHDVALNPQTGDFNPNSLVKKVNTEPMRELVVRTWVDRAAERKSTLVFCVNLDHVHALTTTFRSFGIDARAIDSHTDHVERKLLVSQFKEGLFPVLVNCAILTEGTDIPNVDCVVLARPTRSPNLYAQMIGRGMRLSPSTGKTDCRVMDFVDVSSSLNVVSLPSLFGLDPNEINEEANVEALLQAKVKNTPFLGPGEPCAMDSLSNPKFADLSVSYIDHEDPFSLMSSMSGAPNMFRLSHNAWVGCGDDVYVLPCLQYGDVRIQPREGEDGEKYFHAYFLPQLDQKIAKATNLPAYMRRRVILNTKSLEEAVKGCDTYVSKRVLKGTLARSVLRTARWRSDPATDAQKNFVTSRWAKVTRELTESGNSDKITNMTKGEAANIITRLKHGAQSRYEKKVKELTKQKTLAASEQARLAKYKIEVGPLAS